MLKQTSNFALQQWRTRMITGAYVSSSVSQRGSLLLALSSNRGIVTRAVANHVMQPQSMFGQPGIRAFATKNNSDGEDSQPVKAKRKRRTKAEMEAFRA